MVAVLVGGNFVHGSHGSSKTHFSIPDLMSLSGIFNRDRYIYRTARRCELDEDQYLGV